MEIYHDPTSSCRILGGASKPMKDAKDAKVEKYEGLQLGLPVAALTIRQTVPPTSSQSLTLELLKGEQTIRLDFTDLRGGSI